jgi:hypothetical protein
MSDANPLVPVPRTEVLPDAEARPSLITIFGRNKLAIAGSVVSAATGAGTGLASAGTGLLGFQGLAHIANTGAAGEFVAFIPQLSITVAQAAGLNPLVVLDLATGFVGTKIVLWILKARIERLKTLNELRAGPSISLIDYRKMLDGPD